MKLTIDSGVTTLALTLNMSDSTVRLSGTDIVTERDINIDVLKQVCSAYDALNPLAVASSEEEQG